MGYCDKCLHYKVISADELGCELQLRQAFKCKYYTDDNNYKFEERETDDE